MNFILSLDNLFIISAFLIVKPIAVFGIICAICKTDLKYDEYL